MTFADVPEIDALTNARLFPNLPTEAVVLRSDAESAIRTALDRQAREIVKALREYAEVYPAQTASSAAEYIAACFASKEADPR